MNALPHGARMMEELKLMLTSGNTAPSLKKIILAKIQDHMNGLADQIAKLGNKIKTEQSDSERKHILRTMTNLYLSLDAWRAFLKDYHSYAIPVDDSKGKGRPRRKRNRPIRGRGQLPMRIPSFF